MVSFPSFPHQNPVCNSPLPHTCYMPRPAHLILVYLITRIIFGDEQTIQPSPLPCYLIHFPVTFSTPLLPSPLSCYLLHSTVTFSTSLLPSPLPCYLLHSPVTFSTLLLPRPFYAAIPFSAPYSRPFSAYVTLYMFRTIDMIYLTAIW
jgi:hypothetical protein